MLSHSFEKNSAFTIKTINQNWVIPYNCELLKALVEQQQIKAKDICFENNDQCKSFVKQVFLLALEDETKNQVPSMLAKLGRDLLQLQATDHLR